MITVGSYNRSGGVRYIQVSRHRPCDIVHTLSYLLESPPHPLLPLVDAGQLHAEAAEDQPHHDHHHQGEHHDDGVTVHQVMHLCSCIILTIVMILMFIIILKILINYVTSSVDYIITIHDYINNSYIIITNLAITICYVITV